MAGSGLQEPAKLSTLPPEVRALILDRVFTSDRLVFAGPFYQANSPEWPLEVMRTSGQFYTEGKAALRRALQKVTLEYLICLPIHPEDLREDSVNEDVLDHYNFVRKYGVLIQSLEVERDSFGPLYLADFPNLKCLTIAGVESRRWRAQSAGVACSQVPVSLDTQVFMAWDVFCQNLRKKPNLDAMEELVLDVADKRQYQDRRWKLFVHFLIEKNVGVSCHWMPECSEATESANRKF